MDELARVHAAEPLRQLPKPNRNPLQNKQIQATSFQNVIPQRFWIIRLELPFIEDNEKFNKSQGIEIRPRVHAIGLKMRKF
jgi:hypothetical protein